MYIIRKNFGKERECKMEMNFNNEGKIKGATIAIGSSGIKIVDWDITEDEITVLITIPEMTKTFALNGDAVSGSYIIDGFSKIISAAHKKVTIYAVTRTGECWTREMETEAHLKMMKLCGLY